MSDGKDSWDEAVRTMIRRLEEISRVQPDRENATVLLMATGLLRGLLRRQFNRVSVDELERELRRRK